MGKVLYAWELGGGMGHVGNAFHLLAGLRALGHEVIAAAREPGIATRMLAPLGIPVRPAPPYPKTPQKTPSTYTGVLAQQGWTHLAKTMASAQAWHSIVEDSDPDLIIADHAPTVLLAARGLGIPIAALGTGFCCPVREAPMPCFPGGHADPDAVAKIEAQVVRTANAAVRLLGRPLLTDVRDIFDGVEDLLAVWRELDHYPQRVGASYFGPQMIIDDGERPEWPGEGTRVAGYLKAWANSAAPLVRALAARSDLSSVIFLAGSTEAERSELATAKMRVVGTPLDLRAALEEAEVLVSHGGMGTVSAGLLHGAVQLLMPTQPEQYGTLLRVIELGIGRGAGDVSSPRASEAIEDALTNPAKRVAARALAAKYAGYEPKAAADAMVARCEELMRG